MLPLQFKKKTYLLVVEQTEIRLKCEEGQCNKSKCAADKLLKFLALVVALKFL